MADVQSSLNLNMNIICERMLPYVTVHGLMVFDQYALPTLKYLEN